MKTLIGIAAISTVSLAAIDLKEEVTLAQVTGNSCDDDCAKKDDEVILLN